MGDQVCPFCGAPETDRIDLEGQRFVVFRCLFTPAVDPSLGEEALAEHLRSTYPAGDATYFRGICDRLHLHVTRGTGAAELGAPDAGPG